MSERILAYLPVFYREIKDFTELAAAEDAELTLASAAVDQLFDDQFVLTSSIQALKRRESMLGIAADPAKESVEFRRRRILNRYQTKPPFTGRYVQQLLDTLVGPGMTVVKVDVQQFLLTVTASIENANVFREVVHLVETIKPVNLIYQQNTSIRDRIVLKEHLSRRQVDWSYGLGSWQLGQSPFSTLGTEVVIK